MMNKKLETYLEQQLTNIQVNPSASEMFFHNAFGAIEWEIFQLDDMEEISNLREAWETEWMPRFNKEMWGE